VSGQSRCNVPAYVNKILDLLEASSPFSPGAALVVTVAHDPTCPMSTDPGGCCRCDPDVSLVERGERSGTRGIDAGRCEARGSLHENVRNSR
jgi:hypothetical protein